MSRRVPFHKRICFFASKVSTLLGKNPYETNEKVLNTMIKYYNSGEYKRDEPPTIPDEWKDMVHKMVHSMNTKESSKALRALNTNSEVSETTMEDIRRVVYTERGKKTEMSVLDWFIASEHLPHDCMVVTPSKFSKKHCIKNNQEFFIGGRMDGLIVKKSDQTTVVAVIEIKSRQEEFLSPIPEYEQIQIECYMNMMGVDRCVFLQEYNGEYDIQEYTPNKPLWDTILTYLTDVVTQIKNT